VGKYLKEERHTAANINYRLFTKLKRNTGIADANYTGTFYTLYKPHVQKVIRAGTTVEAGKGIQNMSYHRLWAAVTRLSTGWATEGSKF
jgi:hypothetical protein